MAGKLQQSIEFQSGRDFLRSFNKTIWSLRSSIRCSVYSLAFFRLVFLMEGDFFFFGFLEEGDVGFLEEGDVCFGVFLVFLVFLVFGIIRFLSFFNGWVGQNSGKEY